jgi:hypothetical protein
MLLIKNYNIKFKNINFNIDILIDRININNKSIGSYEYCGQFGVDIQPDIIEDFEIKSVWINNKKLISINFINKLKNFLLNDVNFIKKIQEQLQCL